MAGARVTRALKRLWKAAAISAVVTLTAFAVAKFNFLGIEERTGQVADDVSQRIGLVSYTGPFGYAARERPGQNLIRVISIDEGGVEAMKGLGWPGWPPGYQNLAIMVEDLMLRRDATPQAIFLDLVITGRNADDDQSRGDLADFVEVVGGATGAVSSGLFGRTQAWGARPECLADPLVKLACMVVWDATPIILAKENEPSGIDRGLGSPQASPAQAALSRVALLAPIRVDDRNYPLTRALPGADGTASYELYPATAMYAAHCLKTMALAEPPPVALAALCDVAPIRDAFAVAHALRHGGEGAAPAPTARLHEMWGDHGLATVWSSAPHPRQQALLDTVSPKKNTATDCVEREPWLNQIRGAGVDEDDRRVCEYTLWLGYDRLAAGYGLDDEVEIPLLLKDTLLVVGTRFYNDNDWVSTPIHGSVPGAFYHAMSLDNLIELGPRFRRSQEQTEAGYDDLLTGIMTFLLVGGASYAVMGRRPFARDRHPDRGGRLPLRAAVPWYALIIAAILAVAAGCVAVFTALFPSVLINWIGVLSVVFGAMAAAARLDLIQDIEDDLHRGGQPDVGRFMSDVRTTLDIDHEPEDPHPQSRRTEG